MGGTHLITTVVFTPMQNPDMELRSSSRPLHSLLGMSSGELRLSFILF